MSARFSPALCLLVTACSSAPGSSDPAAMSGNTTSQAVGNSAQTSTGDATVKPAAATGGTAGTPSVSSAMAGTGMVSAAGAKATGSAGGNATSAASGASPTASSAGSGALQPMAASAGSGHAGTAGAAQTGAAGMAAASGAPALPPIMDAGAKGSFEIQVQENLEGLTTHIAIAPKYLGKDGIKHPIVVWINGAGTGSNGYRNMLDNVAAHGFFLLDDKQSTFEVEPEVEGQKAAITWAIEQAEKQGGPYFGKLDTTRIAIAGHSLGGVSTFGNVGDMRIKTSIHMAGGITGNPEGVDESWLQNLHVPTAFLCGDRDSNGLPRVKNDFQGAPPQVPLFFGMLAGVGHTDEFTSPNGGRWGRILISWLRWQLADDASFAKAFQGPSCEFCMGDWAAMKRAID